jgi:hypothetical protein
MWNRLSRVAVAMALTFTPGLSAQADDSSPPKAPGFVGLEGQTLRLTVVSRARVEGTLVDATEETLRVRRKDGTIQSFDRTDLSRVEIAERNSRWRGAGLGALGGGALLGAIGLAAYLHDRGATKSPDGQTCYDGFGGSSACTKASDIPAILVGGAAIGAIIGAIWPGHRYETVQPGRIAVRVAPGRGGVAVAATVGF